MVGGEAPGSGVHVGAGVGMPIMYASTSAQGLVTSQYPAQQVMNGSGSGSSCCGGKGNGNGSVHAMKVERSTTPVAKLLL